MTALEAALAEVFVEVAAEVDRSDELATPHTPLTTVPTERSEPMDTMIETIRAAVTDGATPEQKAAGAIACRTILAALEAEAGKALTLGGAPTPGPLAGISPDQALDLLIARLSAVAEKQPSVATERPTKSAPLRIAFVQPPPRAAATAKRKP